MRFSLCIMGCGQYARTVVRDIHDMTDRIQLFFASRDLNKAKEYCEAYGGAGYFGGYEEAISDPQVHAAYFLTPHHLHLENAELAAQYTKHILIEKPIARTIDESRRMVAVTRNAGVKLMVAENYRFLPTVKKCKELILQGSIGDLRLIQIHFEGYAEYTGWRTRAAYRGGGVFIDGGTHAVDMLVNLGGFPDRVYASTPVPLFHHVEGEDGIVMIGHLPNSAIGVITYSSGTPIRQGRRTVSVTGAKGQLRFSPHGDEIILETTGGDETIRVPEARQGVREMVQEFRASIFDDRVPLMSGDEALKDLTVVLAAYESVVKGHEVKLTLP